MKLCVWLLLVTVVAQTGHIDATEDVKKKKQHEKKQKKKDKAELEESEARDDAASEAEKAIDDAGNAMAGESEEQEGKAEDEAAEKQRKEAESKKQDRDREIREGTGPEALLQTSHLEAGPEADEDYVAKYRRSIERPLGGLRAIEKRYKKEADATRTWLHQESRQLDSDSDASSFVENPRRTERSEVDLTNLDHVSEQANDIDKQIESAYTNFQNEEDRAPHERLQLPVEPESLVEADTRNMRTVLKPHKHPWSDAFQYPTDPLSREGQHAIRNHFKAESNHYMRDDKLDPDLKKYDAPKLKVMRDMKNIFSKMHLMTESVRAHQHHQSVYGQLKATEEKERRSDLERIHREDSFKGLPSGFSIPPDST